MRIFPVNTTGLRALSNRHDSLKLRGYKKKKKKSDLYTRNGLRWAPNIAAYKITLPGSKPEVASQASFRYDLDILNILVPGENK